MKFLFASDSFKGTITSTAAARMLERAAAEVFGTVECTCIPVADGGEGTVDAVIQACGGTKAAVTVHDPLMRPVTACYGRLGGGRAVMEMASASGLPLVPVSLRNPLETTSYGTGELLAHALSARFKDISIAIGGSATNDGGMGCMRALGARFLDKSGRELEGRGRDLELVTDIDVSAMNHVPAGTTVTVMCDVTNPLCGKNGATYTFGAQKGGTPEMLDRLEAGMENYRKVIIQTFGMDPDAMAGAGAAGGLGAALLVFLRAVLKSGIETVLDLTGFDAKLRGVDLVVTGEGRTDWQSCFGKVMQGVGDRCKKYGVPAVALVGSMGTGAEKIFDHGICSMLPTVTDTITLQQALSQSHEDYYAGAVRMFRFIKVGMQLAGSC